MPVPPRKPVLKRKQPSLARAAQRQLTKQEEQAQRLAEIVAINNQYAELADSPFVQDTLGWKNGIFANDIPGEFASYRPSQDRIYVSRVEKPEPDTASTVPLASSRTARSALTHEIGHAQDYRARSENRKPFPEYAKVNRPTFFATQPDRFQYSLQQKFPEISVLMNPEDFKTREAYNPEKKTVERIPNSGIRKMLGIRQKQPMTESEQKAFANLDRYYALGGTKRNDFGNNFLITDPDEALAQAYTNAVGFLSKTGADTTGYREMLGRYEGNTPGAGAIVQDLLRSRPIYQKHPLKGVIR